MNYLIAYHACTRILKFNDAHGVPSGENIMFLLIAISWGNPARGKNRASLAWNKIAEISGSAQMYAVIWTRIRVRHYVDVAGRVLQLASSSLRSDSYVRLRREESWTGIRSGSSSGMVGVVETGRRESRPGRVTITVTGAPVRTWEIIQQKVMSPECKMRIDRTPISQWISSLMARRPVDIFICRFRMSCIQQENINQGLELRQPLQSYREHELDMPLAHDSLWCQIS